MAEEPGAPPGAGGSPEAGHEGIRPEEEPVTTGTLFIMLIFLMAMAAMWVIMYLTLLDR